MRIHTTLDLSDITSAAHAVPGVSVSAISRHASRSRAHGIEIKLHGSSSRQTQSNDGNAATWDQWGQFIANVFDADPDAIVGVYPDQNYFTWFTSARFTPGSELPDDTHPQHKWDYTGRSAGGSYDVYSCTKCSAQTRRMAFGHSFEEIR